MAENITPEEKLLKLIENPAAARSTKGQVKKIRFSLPTIKGLVKALKNIKIGANARKLEHLVNLRSLNKTLIVLSSLFSVYLIFDFVKARPNLDMLNSGQRIKQAKDTGALFGNNLALADYLAQVNKRDIFHFPPPKKEEPDKTKETINSLINNLRLVGIIWSSNPQVMIEDKEENKTWILKQGDEILKAKGKIKIKEIFKDRAILSFEGQEIELM